MRVNQERKMEERRHYKLWNRVSGEEWKMKFYAFKNSKYPGYNHRSLVLSNIDGEGSLEPPPGGDRDMLVSH